MPTSCLRSETHAFSIGSHHYSIRDNPVPLDLLEVAAEGAPGVSEGRLPSPPVQLSERNQAFSCSDVNVNDSVTKSGSTTCAGCRSPSLIGIDVPLPTSRARGLWSLPGYSGNGRGARPVARLPWHPCLVLKSTPSALFGPLMGSFGKPRWKTPWKEGGISSPAPQPSTTSHHPATCR